MKAVITILVAGITLVATPAHTSLATKQSHTASEAHADAVWEALDRIEQRAIEATGLTGTKLDRLVVDYEASKAAAVGREGRWASRIERDTDGQWSVYLVPVQEEGPTAEQENAPLLPCSQDMTHKCGPVTGLPHTL